MEFKFDQLAIYKTADERMRRNRYSDHYYNKNNRFSRDGDVLVKFTVEKYAIEQATNNHELLLHRAREAGARFLIQGIRGPQIIIPGDARDSQHIFRGYREGFEAGFEDNSTYSYYHYIGEPTSFISSSAVAISCRGYRMPNGHVLPGMTGVYSVDTGKKITGRGNILDLLWEQGFLAERSQILYAASARMGTPQDVRAYNYIRQYLQGLDYDSPLRSACVAARRKIGKNCDWPQQYST